MTAKEYMDAQVQIIMIGQAASRIDLDSFLKAIERALILAPTEKPALYGKASANLTAIKKLAESLVAVKQAQGELNAAAFQTSMRVLMEKQQKPNA